MSKNVFIERNDFENDVKRSAFDLSHNNHLSLKLGKITPVFLQEGLPGSTFKIDPVMALKAAPLVFPMQTKLKASLSFFKVNTRTLWKDWTKFITNVEHDSTMPKVSVSADSNFWKTGELADYLGIPTAIYSSSELTDYKTLHALTEVQDLIKGWYLRYREDDASYWMKAPINTTPSMNMKGYIGVAPSIDQTRSLYEQILVGRNDMVQQPYGFPAMSLTGYDGPGSSQQLTKSFPRISRVFAITEQVKIGDVTCSFNSNTNTAVINFVRADGTMLFYYTGTITAHKYSCTLTQANVNVINNEIANGSPVFVFAYTNQNFTTEASFQPDTVEYIGETLTVPVALTYTKDFTDISEDPERNPFANGSTQRNVVPISALPFRAYEAVYNAYYRNERVDPLIINGRKEYDLYCNQEGGYDHTEYLLHDAPWETDVYTSCLPSPMDGPAPLIGLQSNLIGDKITATMTTESGETHDYEIGAVTDSTGNITGFTYSEDIPYDLQRQLNQKVLSGISVNTIRNASAFERYLRNGLRRGKKYIDNMKSHFGDTHIQYDSLQMPTFHGGITSVFNVNQISSTTENPAIDLALGSYAGQMSLIDNPNHTISIYCEEHCYIIGLLTVTPVPIYNQTLPKLFSKFDKFDFYTPEFDQLSMQPIKRQEVSVTNTYAEGGYTACNETFGYQLPWYEYKNALDTTHGQMRTTMKDYNMNRVFHGIPQLSSDFIYCDGETLNNVFAVADDTEDKVFGQIYFKTTVAHPMSRIGEPTWH